MKYNVNINQKFIANNCPDLDFNDAAIIDLFASAVGSNYIKTMDDDGRRYYYFHWKFVIKELPLLKIKGRMSVYRRIVKLINCGFILPHPENQKTGKSWFRHGPLLEKMLFEKSKPVSEMDRPVSDLIQGCIRNDTGKGGKPVSDLIHNNNNYYFNNNTNNNNYSPPIDDEPQKKRKENFFSLMVKLFDEELTARNLPAMDWKTRKGEKFGQLKNLRGAIENRMETEKTEENILDAWRHFLKVAAKVNNGWYLERHFTPTGLYKQFDNIINAYHAEKRTNSSARTGHQFDDEKTRLAKEIFGDIF